MASEIVAHITGTVWKTDVKVGDTAGDDVRNEAGAGGAGVLSRGTRAFDRVRAGLCGLALLLASVACNRAALGRGDECTRSSECAAGLVCVEGACSSSLAGLENPGTVPMVMMGGAAMPMEGSGDGGMTAGAAGSQPAAEEAMAPPPDAGAQP